MKRNKKIQSESDEQLNYSINDLSIDEIIPNNIDNFIISLYENHHTIFLPLNTTGLQFKTWSHGKGGIFSKDILKYSLGKKTAQYVIIKGNDIYCIARLISEEEKPLFDIHKLVDGQIKDVSYMILKNLKNGEKLTNTDEYINEKDIDNEPIMHISLVTPKIPHEDDIDYHVGSISLFTE